MSTLYEKHVSTDPYNPTGTYEVISIIPEENYVFGKLNKSFIHVLVYKAFIGEIPDGCVVDHINTNKFDNRISNLEAVTYKVNSQRSAIHYGKIKGHWNGKVYTDIQIHELCKLMQSNRAYSSDEILEHLGIEYSSYRVKQLNDVISKIKSGKSFRYISEKYDVSNFKYRPSLKENTKAILTEDDVRKIWALLHRDDLSVKDIARMYNVHPATIARIRDKETWAYITADL